MSLLVFASSSLLPRLMDLVLGRWRGEYSMVARDSARRGKSAFVQMARERIDRTPWLLESWEMWMWGLVMQLVRSFGLQDASAELESFRRLLG